jgi:hypothetical protein
MLLLVAYLNDNVLLFAKVHTAFNVVRLLMKAMLH